MDDLGRSGPLRFSTLLNQNSPLRVLAGHAADHFEITLYQLPG